MSASSEKIIQLRQLLADRFGQSIFSTAEFFPTGLSALDEIGLPRAALTEIVASPQASAGGALLLYGLLHALIQRGEPVILIDGKDSFSPKGLPPGDLGRLFWVRCQQAWEALKAADLVVRDGNVPFVILLLALNPVSELRRIPATAWHRLQMLAEKSAVTLVVFSAQAQVGCARLRLSCGGSFSLDAVHRCREELLPSLNLHVERRRMIAGELCA